MRIAALIVSVLLLSLTTVGEGQSTSGAASDSARLIGSWEMVEEQEVDASGKVTARDRDVVGLLVYTPEGRMAVQIMYRRGRPTVSTANDVVSIGLGLGQIRWDVEAARAIIDTYDAYFGTYVVDAPRRRVIHRVMGELRNSELGANRERQYELHDDELWLRSSDPVQRWRIVWRRVRQ